MNAERLLAHYEQIADAPDAIARLRCFILDLAVRGKLVSQDPKDEPASELLKRIAKEKARLVNAGEIKHRDELSEITEDDCQFALPSTWSWCRLGSLGRTQTGTTPPKAKPENYGDYIPFIKPGDLFPNYVDYSNEGLSKQGIAESGRIATPGSIMMVCIGTIGKCQLIDRDCSFNQQINSLSPFSVTNSRYLLAVCQSEMFQKSAWTASARTTIAILNKGNWELLPVPLPPLAEQHRIVAKVDELMALCARLEVARAEREATRDRLAASSLALLNTPDPDTFHADARFVLNALPALTKRPDQIKQLRQTILILAVRGKLVPQDPKDEPASELLKLIGKEKASAQKRQQDALEIDHAEDLGVLPKCWCPVPLLALGSWAIGCGFPKNEQGLDEGPHFFLKVSDMNLPGNEKYITTSNNFIDDDAAGRMRAKIHPPGTIIFPKIGGAIATNKRRILTRGSAIDNNCLGISFSNQVDTEWAYLLLTTLDFTKYQAGTAVPALQQGILERIPVGLPPLAEQHRIVAKVDELMALCARLEASLTDTAATRRRLLDALLTEALAPAEQEAA